MPFFTKKERPPPVYLADNEYEGYKSQRDRDLEFVKKAKSGYFDQSNEPQTVTEYDKLTVVQNSPPPSKSSWKMPSFNMPSFRKTSSQGGKSYRKKTKRRKSRSHKRKTHSRRSKK